VAGQQRADMIASMPKQPITSIGQRRASGPTPRVRRLRDAPRYLGMNRNLFNSEVRPYVTEVRIGQQGVAFDRLELDAWWEQYQSRNGRPAAGRIKPWDVEERRASPSEGLPGTLTGKSGDMDDFVRALARATSKKHS
jgi:hypothetical protein